MQPKLRINPAGDRYEQEADRMAALVMRTPEQAVQRKCACGGTCAKCKGKHAGEEDGALQMKRSPAAVQAPDEAPPSVRHVLNEPGLPLDKRTRDHVEQFYAHDFSQVRVHTTSLAARSAREVNALAYTVGPHIAFDTGLFSPESAAGSRLLAHELTHVVQQGGAAAHVPAARSPVAQPQQALLGGALQRSPSEEDDPTHQGMIDDFRQRHDLPAGIDPSGGASGPSDAEIKYRLIPKEQLAPVCAEVPPLGPNGFKNAATRKAYNEVMCISDASRALPPDCRFSAKQRDELRSAQAGSASRVSKAMVYLKGGVAHQQSAAGQAKKLFKSDPPTITEVMDTLGKAHRLLSAGPVAFAGHTCGDPTCSSGITLAYVNAAGQLPIHICPLAFNNPDGLRRTVLHEALHWAGVDADPATVEEYCTEFDCKTPCLTKASADAWSHYIDCIGDPYEERKDFNKEIERSVEDIP